MWRLIHWIKIVYAIFYSSSLYDAERAVSDYEAEKVSRLYKNKKSK
jgi:hypothetical protein